MNYSRAITLLFLGVGLNVIFLANAYDYEDIYGDDNNNDDYEEDAYDQEEEEEEVYDDAYNEVYGGGDDGNDDKYAVNDDDGIQYWTEYAILPKRCIKHNNVDVIVFSMYDQKYQQCSDKAMGTYVTPVPTFIDAYLAQLSQQAEDMGDEFEAPEAAQYVECYPTNVNNELVYLQIGCSDVTSKEIAVNIYSDATCETSYAIDGYDDANIDVSELQPPFKSCLPCVVWTDTDDQAVDDKFYENRQTNPPLCKNVWEYRSECNKKCQKAGVEKESSGVSWNTSDKVLLSILSLFACALFARIFFKRRTMTNKNLLIEQAALSSIGLQETHVYGIICLWILVIIIFACLDLKKATWAMLLILNLVFFAYAMKLTVASGINKGKAEPMIGPDGNEIPHDDEDDEYSDDDEDDDESYDEDDRVDDESERPKGELA